MKVLYIHHAGLWGGSSRSLYELLRVLAGKGITPYFICQEGDAADIFESLGSSVVRVNGLSQFDNTAYGYYRGWRWGVILRELYYLIPTLSAIIKSRKKWHDIDIIHINEYTLLLPALLAKIFFKKPIFVHCRSLQNNPEISIRARIIQKVYNLMNAHIIPIDEEVASFLTSIEKITIIHNSYNKTTVLNEKRDTNLPVYDENSFILGFVGSISLLKGIIELIEAVAICRKRGLDVHLLVAGKPERDPGKGLKKIIMKTVKGSSDIMKDINQLISDKNIVDYIDFIGFTTDINTIYEKIDLLCFPSRLNAAGRPVFEAAFYQKPALVAVDRSWPDTIIHGETGAIVKENNPASIADAIEYLYKNQDIMKKWGENAYVLANKYFNPDKNAEAIYELYKAVL